MSEDVDFWKAIAEREALKAGWMMSEAGMTFIEEEEYFRRVGAR